MTVQITAVTPQPRIDRLVVDPVTRSERLHTTYRGVVAVTREQSGIFLSTSREPTGLSLFLPDSHRHVPGAEATISAGLATTMQAIDGGDHVWAGPYGAHTVEAALVDDPQGAPVRWVGLRFLHAFILFRTEVSYTVDVITDPTGVELG